MLWFFLMWDFHWFGILNERGENSRLNVLDVGQSNTFNVNVIETAWNSSILYPQTHWIAKIKPHTLFFFIKKCFVFRNRFLHPMAVYTTLKYTVYGTSVNMVQVLNEWVEDILKLHFLLLKKSCIDRVRFEKQRNCLSNHSI